MTLDVSIPPFNPIYYMTPRRKKHVKLTYPKAKIAGTVDMFTSLNVFDYVYKYR